MLKKFNAFEEISYSEIDTQQKQQIRSEINKNIKFCLDLQQNLITLYETLLDFNTNILKLDEVMGTMKGDVSDELQQIRKSIRKMIFKLRKETKNEEGNNLEHFASKCLDLLQKINDRNFKQQQTDSED